MPWRRLPRRKGAKSNGAGRGEREREKGGEEEKRGK
jgi:hypothetical protein